MTKAPKTESAAEAAPAKAPPAYEIVISRVIDATPALAFKMMADKRHVSAWWGPNGFTTTIAKMDFTVGGEWVLVMHGPDGTDYPNRSVFTEIVEGERISYSHSSGKDDTPEKHFIWTFEEKEPGKTLVTMHMLFDTEAAKEETLKHGVMEAGKQTLERLAAHLTKPDGK